MRFFFNCGTILLAAFYVLSIFGVNFKGVFLVVQHKQVTSKGLYFGNKLHLINRLTLFSQIHLMSLYEQTYEFFYIGIILFFFINLYLYTGILYIGFKTFNSMLNMTMKYTFAGNATQIVTQSFQFLRTSITHGNLHT